MKHRAAVVIPNWNGRDSVGACIDSLQKQTETPEIVVVDNGSTDGSLEYLKQNYPGIELVVHDKNKGFAGGVNAGIRQAIKQGADYVALFNNDAVADKNWLKHLVGELNANKTAGIATCKLLNATGSKIDSTGDFYTVWGLPYPRHRNHPTTPQHSQVSWGINTASNIFAATGGASLYRVKMLKEIGLFDDDFFAYYEDVDISFRAQLAGWKVKYVPKAIAYHQIGATSSKIKGFTTYQTLKNLPMLFIKNVPGQYLYKVGWRYLIAHVAFFYSALSRGQVWSALKGDFMGTIMFFKSLPKRRQIQKNKTVSDEYIWQMIVHDLPPNAHKLRKLRSIYHKLKKPTPH